MIFLSAFGYSMVSGRSWECNPDVRYGVWLACLREKRRAAVSMVDVLLFTPTMYLIFMRFRLSVYAGGIDGEV